ncbi:MAG: hypothetical protein R3F11_17070 [Verrucomicrobiales bacterium]
MGRYRSSKSTWARACYDDLKARGCRRYAALRCLSQQMDKSVLFRCWKTREPYDENRYIAALRKAGSPFVPRIDRLLEKADNSADNLEITC